MTKRELIDALAEIPDDAKVLLKCWPDDAPPPGYQELYEIDEIYIVEDHGPGEPTFGVIYPDL